MPLVVARQVVLPRPGRISSELTIGPAITVVAVAIASLQKLLVIVLELVLEDGAMHVRAFVSQPLGLFQIGARNLGVVLQLPRLLNAMVKRLAFRRVIVQASRLEQVAALFGQRDDCRVTIEADSLDGPDSRRCHSSPCRGSRSWSNVSRSSLAGTARNAPTVASVRLSESRSV